MILGSKGQRSRLRSGLQNILKASVSAQPLIIIVFEMFVVVKRCVSGIGEKLSTITVTISLLTESVTKTGNRNTIVAEYHLEASARRDRRQQQQVSKFTGTRRITIICSFVHSSVSCLSVVHE